MKKDSVSDKVIDKLNNQVNDNLVEKINDQVNDKIIEKINAKKSNNYYVEKIKAYFSKLFSIITKNEMRILPGNVAFFLLLSIPPLLTLIGLIGAHFLFSFSSIENFLETILPNEVTKILLPILENVVNRPMNIVIYLIMAFIVASNGANSIVISSNTLYKIESRNNIFNRIKAIVITLVLISLFTLIILLLTFGNKIYQLLLNFDILYINIPTYILIKIMKWPISLFIIYVSIKFVYTISLNKKIPSRYMKKGAAFTSIGWIIVTLIYTYYANNIANYDIFYGSLSNIIVLMMWIYILAYILVIGIAINSSIYELKEKK